MNEILRKFYIARLVFAIICTLYIVNFTFVLPANAAIPILPTPTGNCPKYPVVKQQAQKQETVSMASIVYAASSCACTCEATGGVTSGICIPGPTSQADVAACSTYCGKFGGGCKGKCETAKEKEKSKTTLEYKEMTCNTKNGMCYREEKGGGFKPENKTDIPCNYSLEDFLQAGINFVNFIFGITGSLALLMFVYGGFVWLTSGGSPEKIGQGKKILINSVIAIIITLGAALIVSFVGQALGVSITGGRVSF